MTSLDRASLAVAALVAGCASQAPVAHDDAVSGRAPITEVVDVTGGRVRGFVQGDSLVFEGIPYAAPPTGERRFRAPTPPTPWRAERAATAYGPMCPQLDATGAVIGDEDCLTLNVWTPAGAAHPPLAVLVFLHGGGNTMSGASQKELGIDFFDPRFVAEHGPVVVVTIQYRLGALGFLAHPALAVESEHHASGDYGLLDQIAALQWVRANIGAFGGDPDRVLLFGQSAGARDTCLLVASPLAQGLFGRALVLSGGCNVTSKDAAEQSALTVSESLGCPPGPDAAACLHALPVSDLVVSKPMLPGPPEPFSFPLDGDTLFDRGYKYPSIDGYVLPDSPVALFRAGLHNRMPVVMSTTVDEWTTILPHYLSHPIPSDAAYRAALVAAFGLTFAELVATRYPSGSFASPTDALVAVFSDAGYICPTRQALHALAESQDEPVWRVVWRHAFAGGPLRPFRAGHAIDVWFGFHHLAFDGYSAGPAELTLGDQTAALWTGFAATGSPEGAFGLAWTRYDATADNHVVLDEAPALGAGVRSAECDFWDTGP